MSDLKDPALGAAAQTALHRFRVAFEPLRPELYRFCRHLTRSPWDAEDLVQDTLARAFVMLGSQYGQSIERPRAWMFRVASNLWVDRIRRAHDDRRGVSPGELAVSRTDPRELREAAGTLLSQLSPQERVAVVLKDAFALSVDEVAAALGTSVGTVKSALHRGRTKLADTEPTADRVPAPAALDAFCAAFNAGDLEALTALLLDTAFVEIPGVAIDLSAAAALDPASGILHHTVREPISAGVAPAYLGDYLPEPPRAELRFHRGEHLVLVWHAHVSGEAVRGFLRFELDPSGDRIAYVREYYFSPEALAEISAELGVPSRSNGYGTEQLVS